MEPTATRNPRVRSAIPALWTLLAWHLAGGMAGAIEIEEMRWGFNGKVALSRFKNVLSVLVSNPTPQNYNGEIVL